MMISSELIKTRLWMRTLVGKMFPFGRGNVTKLALAYFFSTLYFYAPVGTLYLRGRGLSYVQINSLWGIIVGTMFLTEVPTGMLADRLGRKCSINVALALQTLGEVIFICNRSGGYPPYMRGIPSWQPPHIGEAPLYSVRKINQMGRDTPICGGKAVLKPNIYPFIPPERLPLSLPTVIGLLPWRR